MTCDCAALLEEISLWETAIAGDDLAIEAANAQKTAHQMQLWYAQYNYVLCGCDGGSGEMVAASSAADATQPANKPVMPVRTPSQIALIQVIPDLWRLHQLCEEYCR